MENKEKNSRKSRDYPGRLFTRFKILVAEKEIRDNRKYTYEDIKEATGIATSTLSAYAQNKDTVKAYKKSTLAKLCNFFECDLSDLLVYEPETKTEEQ